jgi:chromosome segregation ATPase
MTIMITEVYDALIEAGASEERARRAAETLTGYEDRFNKLERQLDNTRVDLENKIASLRADLERQIASLRADLERQIASLRADLERQIARLERRIDATKAELQQQIERLNGRVMLVQWQLGILIAGVAALIIRAFGWGIR